MVVMGHGAMAILLALAASIGYGASDFFAGRAFQRLTPVLVVLYVQAVQTIVVLFLALNTQQPFSFSALLWGVAAGVINAVSLILYYQALSNSPASIISPIVASSAIIPVLVSIVQGNIPTALTIVGLLTVLAGIIVCTSASGRDADQNQTLMLRHLVAAFCSRVGSLDISDGYQQPVSRLQLYLRCCLACFLFCLSGAV